MRSATPGEGFPCPANSNMRIIHKNLWPARECLIWVLVLSAPSLSAQLVNDGATNTLNNVTNMFAGDVTVGTNGSFSAVILTNNTLLTNSADGIIGRNPGAKSNVVLIASPGARWLLSSNLTVGNLGSFNRLLINGGAVRDYAGHLGYSFNSNTNTALVTGSGALWSHASNLFVGVFGVGNRLVVTNGGMVQNRFGYVGYDPGSSNNATVVTGTNSAWSNFGDLFVGNVGTGNQLIITNGGLVQNTNALIGGGAGGNNNAAVVTGPGSLWNNFGSFFVGYSGANNRLLISDGGTVQCNNGQIGLVTSNNVAIVTGTDSVWSNAASFVVGNLAGENLLVVSNGGSVFARSSAFVGLEASSTRNRMVIDGGTLRVTNLPSALDIRRGTNVLNSGLIEVSQLVMTNSSGVFEFNGGTFNTAKTTNNNGRVFTVGNGTNSSKLGLRGGNHFFANRLVISSNASLLGNGTVIGTVTIQPGAAIEPGYPVGVMSFSNSPVLQGATTMEISRNGAVLTNDQIQVSGPITYGGSLTVSNIDASTLSLGDRFKLFNATAYAGAFSALSLPPPPSGLDWTNKLLVDGSIEISEAQVLKFGSVLIFGTNVVIAGNGGGTNATYAVLTSTNVTLPLSNWVSMATNPFGLGGSFSFTNPISPGTPQRFYRLRSP